MSFFIYELYNIKSQSNQFHSILAIMSASTVTSVETSVETIHMVPKTQKKTSAMQAVNQLIEGAVPIADPVKKPRAPKKVKEVVVSEDGEAPTVPCAAKKPRAPKKVKEVVVSEDGEAPVEGEAPPTVPCAAKKPRAPKKVKEVVVSEDGEAPVEGEAPPKPVKKPRAPKKVKEVVEVNVLVDGVSEGPIDSIVAPPSVPTKKPRAPKKVKEVVVPEKVVRSSTPTMPNTIEQCINAIKYLNRTEGKTCDQIKQMVDDIMMKDEPEATLEARCHIPKNYVGVQSDMDLELAFDNMKIGDAPIDIVLEKMDVEKEVVEEEEVEAVEVEEEVVEEVVEEVEEVNEEFTAIEFTLDGELYLKDSNNNLFDYSPPHAFIRNLRE